MWFKKMTNKLQLFTYHDLSSLSIRNIYPDGSDPLLHLSAFPFTHWPNDAPCELVNAYLLDQSYRTTGDTLKTYASQLTHLVRYCGTNDIPFESLEDRDIRELSNLLLREKAHGSPNKYSRNNNTVRDILARCLLFLVWLQDNNLQKSGQVLIGQRKISPQIAISMNTRSAHRNYESVGVYHSAMPPNVSRAPKRPISRHVIENLEQMIESISDLESQSKFTSRRYVHDVELYEHELMYIRARRRFMIWLLKRTGLRPAEMVEMLASDHDNVLFDLRLIIPTKKRRRSKAPTRTFPVTLKDASTVKRYLTCRNLFVESLGKTNTDVPDVFFLSKSGSALKKTSLEKDFSRIANRCGYQNTEVCLSMFRHRFITLEVIVHFKEFMTGSGKSRQIMTDSDYRSILKRIAAKTGHGSEESLWHYIDLAWDELDVWGGVDRAIERLRAADQLFEDLLDLNRLAKTVSSMDLECELQKILKNADGLRTSPKGKPH